MKPELELIISETAKAYDLPVGHILSADRREPVETARQLAMYVARKQTTRSLPEIAAVFGKTHETVIHATRNIEKRLDVENSLRGKLNAVIDVLRTYENYDSEKRRERKDRWPCICIRIIGVTILIVAAILIVNGLAKNRRQRVDVSPMKDAERSEDCGELENPILRRVLFSNGWMRIRNDQIFKVVRRFGDGPSELGMLDPDKLETIWACNLSDEDAKNLYGWFPGEKKTTGIVCEGTDSHFAWYFRPSGAPVEVPIEKLFRGVKVIK